MKLQQILVEKGSNMSKLRDLTGQKFGKLVVFNRDLTPRPELKKKTTRWICKCECGKIISVTSYDVTSGHTNSCGCYHKAQAQAFLSSVKAKSENYHLSKTKAYRCWTAMMRRCYKPKAAFYSYYGGRGIAVCARWHTYKNFLADMGEPPANGTLDRIDSNGDYEPVNCRWATMSEQANNRRSCKFVFYLGEKYSVAAFCKKYSLPYPATMSLIKHGKEPVEIINMYQRNTVAANK